MLVYLLCLSTAIHWDVRPRILQHYCTGTHQVLNCKGAVGAKNAVYLGSGILLTGDKTWQGPATNSWYLTH